MLSSYHTYNSRFHSCVFLAIFYICCFMISSAYCCCISVLAKFDMDSIIHVNMLTENVPKGHFQRLLVVALRMYLTLYLLLFEQSM